MTLRTLSIFRKALLVTLAAGFPALAQVPAAWSDRYTGLPGSTGYDEGLAIALDKLGNIYVAGRSGPIPSGPSCCSDDMVLIKYNAAGVRQWEARYNGSANGHDVANSVVVDRLGNIYVSGSARGVDANGFTTKSDIVILKFSSAGQMLWANPAIYNGFGNGEDSSNTNSLAVDRAGNVYITGESEGVGTNFDIVTIKYNSSGVREWVIPYSGLSPTSNDRGRALTLDPFGNVYVTGRSTGADGFADFVTFKYNPSGQLRWLARYDDAGPNSVDFPNDIALDRFGNVIVVGESYVNFNPATDIPRVSGCKGNFATVKYSPSGQQLWTRPYNGTANCDDYAPVVAVERFIGNIYVSGISHGSGSGTDFATIKYAPNGNEVWVKPFSGTGGSSNPNDSPSDIAIDFFGDVYITGTAGYEGTNFDYATIKYNASGNKLWERRYNVPIASNEGSNALVVNGARDVFVTGWSYLGPGQTDLDIATVKYTPRDMNPVADFEWSPGTPIEDQPIQFTDQSTAASLWAWDFNSDFLTDSTLQNPTHTYPNPGLYSVTLKVTNALGEQRVTQEVFVESVDNVPYVTHVVREYPGFFLDGIGVNNKFDAAINWKGTPGTAAWEKDFGAAVTEPGTDVGSSHTYNMATDFAPSFNAHVIAITPTNGEGQLGLRRQEEIYKFPHPPWLALARSINPLALKFTASGGEIKAEIEKSFPNDPIQKLFVIPQSIPYVGGEFGVRETQATFTASVSSTGIGSLGLSGKTGFKALNSSIFGTASGSGTFRLLPPDGLILQTASFSLGIAGTIERTQGFLQAIPSVAALQAVPVLGTAIQWLDSHATIKGEISPSITFTANFEQQNGDLAFKEGLGKLGCDLKATLNIEVIKNVIGCKAWVGGGGSFTLGVPVTATAPLLRAGEIKLEAGAEFKFTYFLEYTAKATIQAKCSYDPAKMPNIECGTETSTAANMVSALSSGNDGEVRVIEPDYEQFGEYSEFAPVMVASKQSPQVPLTVSETVLLTNVFKGASPHLVELAGGKKLLLFARQDPADPVLQSTDIAWSLYDGANWSAPAVIMNDTQAEIGPVAAVDASGKVVVAWTRIKDAAFSTPITQASQLPQFYTRLEVVTATFDPLTSTWSPITSLTDDTAFDSNVSVVGDGAGNLLLSWLSNPAGEFMSTSTNPSTLKFRTWNGATWSAPANIATGLAGVHSHAAARRGTNAFVILPRDPDVAVPNDGVLDLFTWNGTTWSAASAFTVGGVENRLPAVIYDNAGVGRVVWVRGTDLVHATLAAPTPQLIRAGSDSLSFYDIRLLINAAGNLTILRQDSVDNGPANLMATLYDVASNTWSADRRLTQSPGGATSVTGYFGGDGKIHGAYLSTAITRMTKTVTIGGEQVPIDNIPVDGRTDLLVFEHGLITDLATTDQDLQLTPAFPRVQDSVTATLNVYNAGDFAAGTFTVKLYIGYPGLGGVLVGTSQVAGPFRAGERRQVTFLPFTFPFASGTEDIVAVVDADGVVTEFSELNNRAVAPLASNTPPDARILPSATTGNAPLQITFDATPSFDADGDALQYSWAFSDGTLSATGPTVMHTFTRGGTFPVVLAVTDARGAVGTASVLVTVSVPAPTISGFSPGSGGPGTPVTITGTNFTGATSVTFGGTTATFTVDSPTQISATVPAGAVSGLIAVITPGGTATSATSFTVPGAVLRGDANGDGARTVSDIFYLINHLFAAGPGPGSLAAGDASNDGATTVADVIFLINYLFGGGVAPAP